MILVPVSAWQRPSRSFGVSSSAFRYKGKETTSAGSNEEDISTQRQMLACEVMHDSGMRYAAPGFVCTFRKFIIFWLCLVRTKRSAVFAYDGSSHESQRP